jgi:pyruvate carboxylase
MKIEQSSPRHDQVRTRRKADKSDLSQVGTSMAGVVVDVRVAVGKKVSTGDALAVLSAMKMETVVASPRSTSTGDQGALQPLTLLVQACT